MSRWWLVILLGWLLIAGSYAHEEEFERERHAGMERECGCTAGASLQPVIEAQRPLEEMLELAALRVLGAPSGSAPRLPAPRIERLGLEVSEPHYEPTMDLTLTGELPQGAMRLVLMFEVHGKDFRGHPRVVHVLALTPATQLAALGKPRCGTALSIEQGDRVMVAIAAVDEYGQLGQVTKVEAQLSKRGPDRPTCSHEHCSHPGLLALFLGMCWMLPTVAVMIGTLVVLSSRRSRFRMATAEPMSLGQLHRLCSKLMRTQLAYAVLCLLCGAGLTLRYPLLAPVSVVPLLFALVAALRYRAIGSLLRLAEQPGATFERQGPGVTAVHDGRVRLETFPLALVEDAMRQDVPPMRAR